MRWHQSTLQNLCFSLVFSFCLNLSFFRCAFSIRSSHSSIPSSYLYRTTVTYMRNKNLFTICYVQFKLSVVVVVVICCLLFFNVFCLTVYVFFFSFSLHSTLPFLNALSSSIEPILYRHFSILSQRHLLTTGTHKT